MTKAARVLAILATLVAALAMPSLAPAAEIEARFEAAFTTELPGAPAGLRLAVEFLPADPEAKPPAMVGGVYNLPPGTVVDNLARPRCLATDAEIYTFGRNACPPETQVGSGRLVAITGFGPPVDPFDLEAVLHNAPGQLVVITLEDGTSRSYGFDRITIAGSTLVPNPPSVPGGPPDGRTSTKRVVMDLPAPAAGTSPYVTTPPACPADGLWHASAEFSFEDGSTSRTPVTLPCRPGRARR